MKFFLLISILFFNVYGNSVFKNECSVCHGRKANKKPMGHNVILVKFTKEELMEKILAFQSGKNKRKFMAKNHLRILKPLTHEDIKDLVEYIKGLNK